MSTTALTPVTPAQRAARQLIAERGPLPDHLVRSIAKALSKAQKTETGSKAS